MSTRTHASSSPMPGTNPLLAAYWFSFNFQTAGIITLIVPRALSALHTRGQTTTLAHPATLVAFATMVMAPMAGAWSDRQRRARGSRLPLVWGGAGVNALGWLALLWDHDVAFFAAALIVAVLGLTLAQSSYQAMMPEAVPQSRWGAASGYMGLASLAGTLGGLGAAGLAPLDWSYTLMVATGVAGALTTTAAVRRTSHQTAPRAGAAIKDHRAFRRVFAGRFFVIFGQTLLMTFIL